MSELVLVALITFFFSLGVQACFYLYWKFIGHDHIKTHRHVFNYLSGVIGDGVLVPLVNVFAYLILVRLGNLTTEYYFFALTFAGGLIITLIFHWGQEKYNLTNWTMPHKGHWNMLGLYHAIFMFFESSFLVYVLLSFLKRFIFDGLALFSLVPIGYLTAILLLFFVTFIHDYWENLFQAFFRRSKA